MLAMKKQVLGDFQAEGQTSNTHCHSSGSTQGGREKEKGEQREAVTLNSSHDRSKWTSSSKQHPPSPALRETTFKV